MFIKKEIHVKFSHVTQRDFAIPNYM